MITDPIAVLRFPHDAPEHRVEQRRRGHGAFDGDALLCESFLCNGVDMRLKPERRDKIDGPKRQRDAIEAPALIVLTLQEERSDHRHHQR